MNFRLTYSTMYDPPEALHDGFEAALARVSERLGACQPLFIDGEDRESKQYADGFAPFDRTLRLGSFAMANETDSDAAMRAADAAFPAWRDTPVVERTRMVRRVADLLEQRVYDVAAAMVLEVGKNRMEALGEAQETVDLIRCYADDFESHDGYAHALPDDPIEGMASHNASVMRPYGVWVVISPFNFPLALAGGPVAAALVTGNTVVLKGASDTPWCVRLLADCIRDAGLPTGVFNCLSGSSRDIGAALVQHPCTAGITFTGSVSVGRSLMRQMAGGAWPRPCIAEMGGKNPCIVTEHANLDDAAAGIVRSAYGLTGQKCSALSRLYVHADVADALVGKLIERIGTIRVGDPRRRENWMGPVINASAYANFKRFAGDLEAAGATMLAGGKQLGESTDGPQELSRGFFVEPTLAEVSPEHPLWQQEMFVPILLLHRYHDRNEAMRLANDTALGLTAGFYGGADEVPWFHDHIEAGVVYSNRPQGATTGAWPGYQPFGGWKGSSSTGKAIASFYYLAQYLREQSRTVVE
ncbi:MAG TPA: aldehyde dehydrogenase family protein [Rhodanobacteraceae bacterium]|nr:aldehyde dehydrogenase family protein [Rhodanobacteraceae bacterium]